MAGARADDMRGNEKPRSFHKTGIERVAQIDRRPFRIDAAEIAQGRKAVVHVFAGEAQPLKRFGRGRLERLQREVRGVHREMDMGVDESGAHRPLGEIDHPCAGRSAHRALDLRNPVVLDENLGWAG